MFLHHGATTAQIRTGDVLIQRVATGGTETQFPATLQYVFATVPALVSYNDGQGDATAASYPVAAPNPPINPGGPGTRENPFPVKVDPKTGDVVLTLTFWNTLTYTVNLTQCLASNGSSWEPGAARGFDFAGVTPTGVDNAHQFVAFKRQNRREGPGLRPNAPRDGGSDAT